MNSVIIKQSKIHGKGLFATCDIKKGEMVLKWNPRVLTEKEVTTLTPEERKLTFNVGPDRYYYMQEPERYMNHSCENNTTV